MWRGRKKQQILLNSCMSDLFTLLMCVLCQPCRKFSFKWKHNTPSSALAWERLYEIYCLTCRQKQIGIKLTCSIYNTLVQKRCLHNCCCSTVGVVGMLVRAPREQPRGWKLQVFTDGAVFLTVRGVVEGRMLLHLQRKQIVQSNSHMSNVNIHLTPSSPSAAATLVHLSPLSFVSIFFIFPIQFPQQSPRLNHAFVGRVDSYYSGACAHVQVLWNLTLRSNTVSVKSPWKRSTVLIVSHAFFSFFWCEWSVALSWS